MFSLSSLLVGLAITYRVAAQTCQGALVNGVCCPGSVVQLSQDLDLSNMICCQGDSNHNVAPGTSCTAGTPVPLTQLVTASSTTLTYNPGTTLSGDIIYGHGSTIGSAASQETTNYNPGTTLSGDIIYSHGSSIGSIGTSTSTTSIMETGAVTGQTTVTSRTGSSSATQTTPTLPAATSINAADERKSASLVGMFAAAVVAAIV